MAPFLFNLTIDWTISRVLEGKVLGIALVDMVVADLKLADDICLLDDNQEDVQKLID